MRRNQQPPGQCDGSQALNTCCLLLPSSAVSLLKVPTTLSKTPQTRWLKHHKCIVSQFWRPDVQGPGAGRGGFLRGLSPPGLQRAATPPQPPPGHPPTLPLWSLLCVRTSLLSLSWVVMSSSYQDTSQIALGPTRTASPYYLFKRPKSSHTLRYEG